MALDFVVFGVPRSGTTALAQALNLHPRVMCGIEYLPGDALHVHALPAAFDNHRIAYSANAEVTREIYRGKRDTAQIFGNKDPRLYLGLQALVDYAPACKRICIYRPGLGFWSSWDTRAGNHADAHWHRGQTGFIGVLELACLLGALSDITAFGEVLIVNFDSLFFDDPNTIQLIYDYIGAERLEDTLTAFRGNLFSPASAGRSKPNEEVDEICSFLQLPALDGIMAKPVFTNIEIADDLIAHFSGFRNLLAELIDCRFPEFNPWELAYFLKATVLRTALATYGIRSRAQRAIAEDEGFYGCVGLWLDRLQSKLEG